MSAMGQLHHCRSQGTPSSLPSIFVFGQCWTKYVASSQEVICEHIVRPSHSNEEMATSPSPIRGADVDATPAGTCCSTKLLAVADLYLPYPNQAIPTTMTRIRIFFTSSDSPRYGGSKQTPASATNSSLHDT